MDDFIPINMILIGFELLELTWMLQLLIKELILTNKLLVKVSDIKCFESNNLN